MGKINTLLKLVASQCPTRLFRYNLFRLAGVKISNDSLVERKVLLGKGSIIGSLSHIYRNVYIDKSVIIGENVKIYPDSYIDDHTSIKRDSVICSKAFIGRLVQIAEGVHIGKNAVIKNGEIHKNSFIDDNVIFTGYGKEKRKGKVIIGEESYIGVNNILDWSDNITIGNFVHIAGPSTGLWTHTSFQMCLNSIPLNQKSKRFRPTAPIVIEDNVYIGGNCTLYPGVTIHHHSVVAPNSAVTKDVESYSFVGGVPAKFIKRVEPEK
jgi:acetyltransferase-like isoleucine patch superfamily enzyme